MRIYDKQDIYDYLLQCYGLRWDGFKVYDKCHTRPIQVNDYRKDELKVLILLFKGESRHIVNIKVSNDNFNLCGIESNNDINWQDFLSCRYNKDKTL